MSPTVKVALLFAAVSMCATAAAQPSAPSPSESVREAAPLVVVNRHIFVFRAPVLGHSASDRADAAAKRIGAALAQNQTPTVGVGATPGGTAVLLDDKAVFIVTPGDVNTLAGDTIESAGADAAKRLQQAIVEWREQRKPAALAVAAGVALLATLLYGAIVRGLFVAKRAIEARIARRVAAHTERLHLGGVFLIDPAAALAVTRRVARLCLWLLALMATYVWAAFVLARFPYTRPWGEQLKGYLVSVGAHALNAIAAALPGLLLVLVIFVIARLLLQTAGLFFDRVQKGRAAVGWLNEYTVVPTRRIFGAIVWLFAIAIAYPYLPGAGTDAFKGLSVLVGVMVSIGASSLVGQAASGLILMYTQTFRAGEYVRIGDTEGTVMELGMFATRLRTGVGEEIMLPNSTILSGASKNYSRAAANVAYVLDTTVTIGYDVPWRQVHAMLEEAARRTSGVAAEPAPFVRQTGLLDHAIEYRLVAYSTVERPAGRADLLHRLHANVLDLFNEYGVQIASPHYEADPEERKVVPPDKWYAAPARPPSEGAERARERSPAR